MNILRHELDRILFYSNYHTPPVSTPCWEWISEKFKKAVSRYAQSLCNSVTITMGDKWFSLEVDEEFIESDEMPFSLDDVMACCNIAEYNFLQVREHYDFEGDVCREIVFVYN